MPSRKQPEPAAPRPVGRPKSRPAGAKLRSMWLTAAEFDSVREHVKQMRERKAK